MGLVLFLTPRDLGETVLATGALLHLLGADDELVLAGEPDALALLRAVPQLVASRALAAPANAPDLAQTWLALTRRSYSVILDARRGVLGRVLPTSRRVALRPAMRLHHRVEDWTEACGADHPLTPNLWLDQAARAEAAKLAPSAAPVLLLAPGGVTAAKRWPEERFAAVARRLTSGPLAGARTIVLGAAARDAEITRLVAASLDADGVSASDLGRGPNLLVAAALMERATLCIGNDNALTHIAAAAGAATLTLFGPTDERVRAPWGPRTRTLRGLPLERLDPALDANAAMGDVSIDAVEGAALELLRAGGLQ
jgi:ADP-heptose:LPS heptosyltransferase